MHLSIRQDHFCSAESIPKGKTLVAACGWDDLPKAIELFETQNEPVNCILIGRFPQNYETTEHFTRYSELLSKYQSDHQAADILREQASGDIRERARAVRFDKRLVLIHPTLDGLGLAVVAAKEKRCTLAFSVRQNLVYLAIWLFVLFALMVFNKLGRAKPWAGVTLFLIVPIVLTVFAWPASAAPGNEYSTITWFNRVKTHAALAGRLGFMALCFAKRTDKDGQVHCL